MKYPVWQPTRYHRTTFQSPPTSGSATLVVCLFADVDGDDQPLVITNNPQSVFRTRQSLYEAVLQLEKQDLIVVERRLEDCDIVLNASTCISLWTEEQIRQVKLGFISSDKQPDTPVWTDYSTSLCL